VLEWGGHGRFSLCVPPGDGVLFSMASRDQHGLSGGSKTL
jgi:hypothetical protein